MPRNQSAFVYFSVQFSERFKKNLTVAVYLICHTDEAGKIQEINGYTVVAVLQGGPFQAHHFTLGLDMGGVKVAQGSQRSRDGEIKDMARLEREGVYGVEKDAT